MKKLLLLPILFLSFVYADTTENTYLDEFSCVVTEVISGNEFNCLRDNKEDITITLYQLYAPKLNQPYGMEAKNFLSEMIQAKRIYFFIMRPHPHRYEIKRVKNRRGRRSLLAEIFPIADVVPNGTKNYLDHESIGFIMVSNGYV